MAPVSLKVYLVAFCLDVSFLYLWLVLLSSLIVFPKEYCLLIAIDYDSYYLSII